MSDFETTEAAADTSTDSSAVVHLWDRADGPIKSIIDAVTEATGADPSGIPVLYEVVDPDALETLLGANDHSGRDRSVRSVTFLHGGCEVTVESTGRTVASPLDED